MLLENRDFFIPNQHSTPSFPVGFGILP